MRVVPEKNPATLEEALELIAELRAHVAWLNAELARRRFGEPDDIDALSSEILGTRAEAPRAARLDPPAVDELVRAALADDGPVPADVADAPEQCHDALERLRARRERSEAALLALLASTTQQSRTSSADTRSVPHAREEESAVAGSCAIPGPETLPSAMGSAPASLPDSPQPPRRARQLIMGALLVPLVAGVILIARDRGDLLFGSSAPLVAPTAGVQTSAQLVSTSVPRAAPFVPDVARDDSAGQPTPPPPSDLVLSVTVVRPCWLRVMTDGSRAFEGKAIKDQALVFTARDALTVRVGDAGAVRFTLNGEELGAAGADGAVLTRRFDRAR